MKSRAHTFAAFGITATLLLLALASFAWGEMRARESAQDMLKANIAEIARIDEVLTSSALLATATGDMIYRERYYDHVDDLDRLLTDTITSFESAKAEQMLAKTYDANVWLVATEESALSDIKSGPSHTAYNLLRSDEYAQYKAAYADGLNSAMQALKFRATNAINQTRIILTALTLAAFIAVFSFLRLILLIRAERREMEGHREKVVAMRGLLSTFMDVQNNLLNNMVYFRTKAAHALPFDERDVRMIDAEIEKAKVKLSGIVDTGISSTTRDLGGIVVSEVSNMEEQSAA